MISCPFVLSGIATLRNTPTSIVFGIYPCSLLSITQKTLGN